MVNLGACMFIKCARVIKLSNQYIHIYRTVLFYKRKGGKAQMNTVHKFLITPRVLDIHGLRRG